MLNKSIYESLMTPEQILAGIKQKLSVFITNELVEMKEGSVEHKLLSDLEIVDIYARQSFTESRDVYMLYRFMFESNQDSYELDLIVNQANEELIGFHVASGYYVDNDENADKEELKVIVLDAVESNLLNAIGQEKWIQLFYVDCLQERYAMRHYAEKEEIKRVEKLYKQFFGIDIKIKSWYSTKGVFQLPGDIDAEVNQMDVYNSFIQARLSLSR